jgi:glycerol kinase
MSDQYILAIDQGTSGTKAVIFDQQGQLVAKATEPLTSYYPIPGFVEQNPHEIYQNVLAAVKACLAKFKEDTNQIVTCGISNQRETLCLWDESGQPLCPAVVWQCKRSVEICNRLKGTPLEREIIQRTGLIADPYFSGTKLMWLYENDARIKKAIDQGQALFGNVDTWLLYKLTGGQHYTTDYTNASRTLFFNLDTLDWDRHLLRQFNLSGLKLPEPKPSSHAFGNTDFDGLLSASIPIGALIGDSHAAAFGEGCFTPGTAKATLGTGCSILLNTGNKRIASTQGMVTTICWSTTGRVDYALEGIIVTCGATINWLKNKLDLFAQSKDTETMALSVPDNNGVYLVPAFSGLGAPHWQMNLKAAIVGLTLGCDKSHIVRAALESIPYQIKDVISAMELDSGIALHELRVDGGISANTFVMQFLTDLLKTRVVTIGMQDVSALGAAYMAGLHQGIFEDIEHLGTLNMDKTAFNPGPLEDQETASTMHKGWTQAIKQLT